MTDIILRRRLPSDLVLETKFRANGGAARRLSEAAELDRAHCRNRPRQAEPNDLEKSARCGEGRYVDRQRNPRSARSDRPETWSDSDRHVPTRRFCRDVGLTANP